MDLAILSYVYDLLQMKLPISLKNKKIIKKTQKRKKKKKKEKEKEKKEIDILINFGTSSW